MKKNLTTPAGRTEQTKNEEHLNAINQVFAIFRRNYHNQFFKAFPAEQDASIAKRLWLDSLQRFPHDTILKAAKSVIESSEFLPTLAAMIRHCEEQNNPGLPEAHAAYIEACRAPSPKANYGWSHPAVYYAGKECDWFFLQSNSEDVAFPVFKKCYEKFYQRVLQGETLPSPQKIALPENLDESLDNDTNLKNLNALREQLDL